MGPDTLVCFGEFLLRSFRASKSVLNALASVKRLHLDAGLHTGAFEAPELMRWRRALLLTNRHVPTGAPPFPVRLLRETCERVARLGQKGEVFAALLSVMFYAMVRVSSLLPASSQGFDSTRLPMVGDVVLRSDGTALLRVKWAKNAQQASAGFTVPLLPVKGTAACPVANLRRLLALQPAASRGQPLFAFPRVVGQGKSYKGFTISLARVWFATVLRAAGHTVGSGGYSLHSLRRGACSLAFRNGAQEADLQALGGWRSGAVRCYYAAGDARRRAASALVAPF